MESFLKGYHRRILIIGVVLYILMMIAYLDFSGLSFVLFFSFTSYCALILYFINKNDSYFTSKNLIVATFLYTLLILILFFIISFNREGDTFLFSKVDAMIYWEGANKIVEMSTAEIFKYLNENFRYDDWGAFIMMGFLMKIINAKLFVNFCYLIFGAITAWATFNTAKKLMPVKNAFIASFAFASASYAVFFYGAFVKECFFVMIISLAFNCFYNFLADKKIKHIYYFVLYVAMMFFFRPAVALFIILSVGSYYAFLRGQLFTRILFLLAFVLAIYFSASIFRGAYESYTYEGDIASVLENKYNADVMSSAEMGYRISWLSSLFGPFPTLMQIPGKIPKTALFAPGLLYKLFLIIFFWMAVYYIIRQNKTPLIPLIVFPIVEMIALSVIQEGYELRKALPHYSAIFMVIFWYISNVKVVVKFQQRQLLWMIIVFILVVVWNNRGL